MLVQLRRVVYLLVLLQCFIGVSGEEGVPGGAALCTGRGSEFVVAENMLNGALVNLHEVIEDGEACLKAWGEDVVACNRNAEFMGVTANETADLVKKIMGAENGANCTVDTTVSALKKEVDQKKAAFDEAVKKTERLVVLARDAQKLCSAVTGNVDDRFLRLSSTLKSYEDHLGYKEYSVCVTPEKTERVTEVKRLHDELSGIKRRLDVMKGHTQVCRVIGGAVSPVGIMNKALKDLSSTCGQEITSSEEIKVPVEGKGEKSERYDEAVILPDGRLRKNATDKTTMVSMKAGEQFPFIKGSALQINKTTVQRFKKTFDTARKIVIEERRKNEEKRLAEEWERKEREKKEKEERERAAAAQRGKEEKERRDAEEEEARKAREEEAIRLANEARKAKEEETKNLSEVAENKAKVELKKNREAEKKRDGSSSPALLHGPLLLLVLLCVLGCTLVC